MEGPKSHPENIGSQPESNAASEKERKEQERLERGREILALVERINESGENLPFPGINPEDYEKMKAADEEFPGFSTPTDEIIARCEREGIKVVLGDDRTSGNAYALPAGSDNAMDSIMLRQLVVDNVQNEDLRKLIELKTEKVR